MKNKLPHLNEASDVEWDNKKKLLVSNRYGSIIYISEPARLELVVETADYTIRSSPEENVLRNGAPQLGKVYADGAQEHVIWAASRG